MSINFNHTGKLRRLALCLAALFCLGQGAAEAGPTDIKVAVIEPSGGNEVKSQIALVRSAFIEALAKNPGFQVIDRAKTDQILKEHKFQRTSGLIPESEARELGRVLGVDLIFVSEVTEQPDAVMVNCQALDIVSGRVVAMNTDIIEGVGSRQFIENCKGMMADMLKTVNRNSTGRASAAKSVLPGLDAEIAKMVMNNKSNAKWNRNKANYSLEVDLAGVSIAENRQFETPVFNVSGTISIMLSDAASGDTVGTDVELDKFTEMSDNLIRNKIKAQVQPKLTEIVRDLLSSLD